MDAYTAVGIKGMTMPKSCHECRLEHYEGQGAFSCKAMPMIFYDDDEVFKPWKSRHKNCPLIEIR